MSKQADFIFIGAGIVGLASAYQLLKKTPKLKLKILEKEANPACHQTGHNSGVVHSGIYYKPGSLKAKNCRAGRKELLHFCDRNEIPYQAVGKLIVATNREELPMLREIQNRGLANGVSVAAIGPERMEEIEPNVKGIEALWIPDCQIVDYKKVAAVLVERLVSLGAEISFNCSVIGLEEATEGCIVKTSRGDFLCKKTVNCAGLYSDRIAKSAMGNKSVDHQILPFRGEYYELVPEKRSMVKGLIYPVPDPNFPFLGVHLTRMIDGKVEAGPNAILAFAREGYKWSDIDLKDCFGVLRFPGFWKMAGKYWKAGFYEMARSLSKKLFLKDLQKLMPALTAKDLIPAGAGIRAQAVSSDGKMLDDFLIAENKNMIHVLNAPSPAATASFAIGRQIAERALENWEKS